MGSQLFGMLKVKRILYFFSQKFWLFLLSENKFISTKNLNNLKKQIQMIAVLSLFLPTIFDALEAGGADLNKSTLEWSAVVGFLVLVYLLVEIFGSKISSITGDTLNILFLTNIFAFAPMFFIVAQYKNNLLPLFPLITLWGSLIIVNLMSIVVIVVITLNLLCRLVIFEAKNLRLGIRLDK